MDLILWRHAQAHDAEPGQDDLERPLTAKGRDQAKRMADWLRPRLPKDTRILVSPALRTRQTAEALDTAYTVTGLLAPDASCADLIEASGWPSARHAVLVVGHQPTLGLLAFHLMTNPWEPPGEPSGWSIRKGAIWWLRHHRKNDSDRVELHAVINP